VWLALEEKEIQYDSVMINLQNKPDWYAEVVPTKLVPAAAIHGQIVWESKDILLALEKAFPDSRPLLPRDASLKAMAEELLAEMEKHGVDSAGFRFMAAGAPALLLLLLLPLLPLLLLPLPLPLLLLPLLLLRWPG
jgi:glutathione S-transferase